MMIFKTGDEITTVNGTKMVVEQIKNKCVVLRYPTGGTMEFEFAACEYMLGLR